MVGFYGHTASCKTSQYNGGTLDTYVYTAKQWYVK